VSLHADLEAASLALEKAKYKLERDRDDAIRRTEVDFDKANEPRRAHLVVLNKAVTVAREAYEDDLVRKAAAPRADDIKIGMKMVEWTNGRSYFGSHQYAWRATGRTGRVDVWTRETVRPDNMRWGLPAIGDLFIRILKKDGSDSALFETLRGGYKSTWLREGQKPGKA